MSLEILHPDSHPRVPGPAPTQSIRDGKPLPEGFLPCVHCAITRRAITDVYPMWRLEELPDEAPFPTEAPYTLLQHWHDDGKPDAEWSNLKRYCHGHTCTTPDVKIVGSSPEDVRRQWNARQIEAADAISAHPLHAAGALMWPLYMLGIGALGYLVYFHFFASVPSP